MSRAPIAFPTPPGPGAYVRLQAEWARTPGQDGRTLRPAQQGVLTVTEQVWNAGGQGSLRAGRILARIAKGQGAPDLAKEIYAEVRERQRQLQSGSAPRTEVA